jgi:hypothetical protein
LPPNYISLGCCKIWAWAIDFSPAFELTQVEAFGRFPDPIVYANSLPALGAFGKHVHLIVKFFNQIAVIREHAHALATQSRVQAVPVISIGAGKNWRGCSWMRLTVLCWHYHILWALHDRNMMNSSLKWPLLPASNLTGLQSGEVWPKSSVAASFG